MSTDIKKINEFLKEIKKIQVVPENKIYLTSRQVEYKEYFEREGYEVVLTDTLPQGINIIYGKFE